MDIAFFHGIDRNHPLFTKHKRHRLAFDTVISFPPGTGGNFLTTVDRTAAGSEINSSVNAFDGIGAHNMVLDDIAWNQQIELDTLHAMVSTNPPLPDPSQRVARCHNLPWLAMRVFDLTIEELIVITMHEDDAWFPAALNKIKWLCNRDWNSNPDMMYQLLEDAHHTGEVRVGEYRLLCDTVRDRFGVDCSRTVISWKHYMYCKQHGIALDDIQAFQTIFTGSVFQTLKECAYGEIDRYGRLWRGPIYQAQLLDLKREISKTVEIDYMRLMADVDNTSSRYLQGIDRHAIAHYTMDNIAMIRQWLPCCLPEMMNRGWQKLDAIDDRLRSSGLI